MKSLKLLLIFLVLVGGLFVALNWKSIITTVMGNGDKFVGEDLIHIGEKCEEIRNAWGRCTEWDESLYNAQRADIDQSKSMGMFSREGYNTVNNALRESATNKACGSYLACLHDTLFDSSKLQQQYDGVQFLKEHEKLENDPRVKDVEERHAVQVFLLLLDQRPKILWVAPHGLFHQAPLAFVHGSQLLFPFSAC